MSARPLILAGLLSLAPIAGLSEAPAPTPTPTPSPTETAPPYEAQLLRLAEVLGALSFLRDLCGAGDGAEFRAKMASLLDAEGRTPALKADLAGAFNRGFRDFQLSYRVCTPNAREAAQRYSAEAAAIAKAIADRYGG